MTDNDNHKLSDQELEDYLAGRHEVSGAYQALEKTGTPPELDAKILAQARESAAETRSSRGDIDRFYRPYAVAATLFLCVTIALMLVRDPPPSGLEALDASRVSQPQTAPAPAADEVPAAQDSEADLQFASEAAAPEPAFAPAQAVGNIVTGEAERQESTAVQRQSERAAFQDQAGTVAADSDAQGLAEAIPAAREAAPAYRENRDDWLAEIQRLRAAGQDEQAALEAELFLASYPETDLEAALESL